MSQKNMECPKVPRVAVVVASSADLSRLRGWLEPIAVYGADLGVEIVVARRPPLPEPGDWGPRFADVRFIAASGDDRALRRAGAEATRADLLLLTDDTKSDSYIRMVKLVEALGLQQTPELQR
jgi:hypothetical protein